MPPVNPGMARARASAAAAARHAPSTLIRSLARAVDDGRVSGPDWELFASLLVPRWIARCEAGGPPPLSAAETAEAEAIAALDEAELRGSGGRRDA